MDKQFLWEFLETYAVFVKIVIHLASKKKKKKFALLEEIKKIPVPNSKIAFLLSSLF